MTIDRITLKRFTAFETLDFRASPGVNVLIGANGTGKTHLMKVAYAACDVSKTGSDGPDFAGKLVRVFLPLEGRIGRLVRRAGRGARECEASVHRGDRRLSISFGTRSQSSARPEISGFPNWIANPVESAYIPVKEMLANAPGFRSLYVRREIHFEEIYQDILNRAYTPLLRDPMDRIRSRLLRRLRKDMNGPVVVRDDNFFLARRRRGNLEFTLLAEGIRKLGLLSRLIQNGTLSTGAILFWDEPETNLSPKFYKSIIDVILELQRTGVQIFLATHDYAILKEIDLQSKPGDKIFFHSFHDDPETGEVVCHTADRYLRVRRNAIDEAFDELYDREVERSMGGYRG